MCTPSTSTKFYSPPGINSDISMPKPWRWQAKLISRQSQTARTTPRAFCLCCSRIEHCLPSLKSILLPAIRLMRGSSAIMCVWTIWEATISLFTSPINYVSIFSKSHIPPLLCLISRKSAFPTNFYQCQTQIKQATILNTVFSFSKMEIITDFWFPMDRHRLSYMRST